MEVYNCNLNNNKIEDKNNDWFIFKCSKYIYVINKFFLIFINNNYIIYFIIFIYN
jgi:hypothetical protein